MRGYFCLAHTYILHTHTHVCTIKKMYSPLRWYVWQKSKHKRGTEHHPFLHIVLCRRRKKLMFPRFDPALRCRVRRCSGVNSNVVRVVDNSSVVIVILHPCCLLIIRRRGDAGNQLPVIQGGNNFCCCKHSECAREDVHVDLGTSCRHGLYVLFYL